MGRFRIGDAVVVDTAALALTGPEGAIEVEPQVFDVLAYLLGQRGRLVTKEELLDNVWGDRFVSESALTTRIKQVRKALGDDGRAQWAVKTVHRRGYRFVAPVEELPDDPFADAHQVPTPPSSDLPEELRADARQLFVGRDAELAASIRVLDRSDTTTFGWIWLVGEPGIGKSRLAAEVARRAQERGHLVLSGRNNEDLQVPYQPFIELGAPILDASPGDGAADDATRRYRMFEAVAEWLLSTAAEAPVTAIIDDLHWASDSTLQLLAHLQRRTGGGPVTFVITARDTAPDSSPRVADMLGTSQGVTDAVILRLGGLSNEDALRLVGDASSIDEVMKLTAGNPLLLQAVNPSDGSVDVAGAVRRRLASLAPEVQETLQTASVIGAEFQLHVAATATGRDELDVLDDLEEAIAARLLDDLGVDRFRFTHALVRSSLRDELSSARRARLHRRIADAIEKVGGSSPDQLPALAFHTAEAAAADRALAPLAIERLTAAAAAASEQLSFDEAAALLGRARVLADPDDDLIGASLALDQGIAETRAGAGRRAVATFDDAVAAARRSGDPRLRIESVLRFEDATWRPGLSGDPALARLAEASEVLESEGDTLDGASELGTRLAIARLRANVFSGRAEEAEAAFAATLAAAREVGTATLEAGVLNVYLGHVRFFRGLDGTADHVARLAELQDRIDDSETAQHAAHIRLMHALLSGDFVRLAEMAALVDELQERSRSGFWGFIRVNQRAMEALYTGDLDRAEQMAELCATLADEIPGEDGSGTYGLRMFLIRREQDRLATMAPLVRTVLSRSSLGGLWIPGLALLLCETGDEAEAMEVVAPVKAASFDIPVDALWSTVMVFLVETMVHLHDLPACAELRERLAPLAGSTIVTGPGLICFGRAERYLGMLSFALGELDRAEEELGVALESDAATGSVLWANESRLWLARVRRAQGHVAEADAMDAVVAEQAADAGLARLHRLAVADGRG